MYIESLGVSVWAFFDAWRCLCFHQIRMQKENVTPDPLRFQRIGTAGLSDEEIGKPDKQDV